MDTNDLIDADLTGDTTIMDTAMDGNLDPSIDELFGEATDALAADPLGVVLPSLPLPPELVVRVANMQIRGCCTKLAFSNTGSIAQIVDKGKKITFRAICRNCSSGDWWLTDESKHPLEPWDGARWEHIQFSNIGIDLAATDSLGHVYIYTLIGALGKMPLASHNIVRNEQPHPDLDAVVGLYWVPMYPTELRFPNVSAANKTPQGWTSFLKLRDPNEPVLHHPADGRQALLYVARNSKITLMYQVDTTWHAVDTKLEEVISPVSLITHASFSEEGDHVLLATHSVSRCIRLYRVSVAWNTTQAPRQNGQALVTVVNPTIEVRHLTMEEHVMPQHSDAAKLSQLSVVGAIPSNASSPGVVTSPTVLAVFTRAAAPMDLTQQTQEAYSVVSSWHVQSAAPALHEAFNKLKKNTTANGLQTRTTQLERQDDVFLNKVVLCFEAQHFNTLLAFAASDGTVEFRDRLTMASIEPFPDPTTVTSLPQSGFEHLMDQQWVHVAMNGDAACLATAATDRGTVVQKKMSLRYTWDFLLDGGLVEAAVVCLARQYAVLTCTNISTNETLAMLPSSLSAEMRALFVKEVIRMLRRDLDVSMHDSQRQQNTVVREALLPKAMSAQLVLGRKPGTQTFDPAGKYATAFVNVRLASTALLWVLRSPSPDRPDTSLRPDFLLSISGLAKWASVFLVYIVNSLLILKRRRDSAPNEPIGGVCEAFNSEENNPALYFLLCTYSRTYLRFLAGGIPKYLATAQKLMSMVRSASERQQLMEVLDFANTLPFKYNDFESFISTFDTAVRDAYTSAALMAPRRTEIELASIACDAHIPAELSPALQTLCDTAIPAFMDKMDLARVHSWDTTWLGIEPTLKRQEYDVIRKVPLVKGMKLRVCRRCGAMMEDLSIEKARDLAPALAHLGRHCVCADFWLVDY